MLDRVSEGPERGVSGARVMRALADLDWTPDLGAEIGSRRWTRGMATLASCCALALAFWPSFEPLSAAPSMPRDGGVRDQFREQLVAPLDHDLDRPRVLSGTARMVPISQAPERPQVKLTTRLANGAGLGRSLMRVGVAGNEAGAIAAMVASAVPLSQIEAGTEVAVTLGRRPAPTAPRSVEAVSLRPRFDLGLTIARSGGGLRLSRQAIAVDETPLRISGVVGAGLYRSARAAGAPVSAIQHYLRALDDRLSIEQDIAPGDRFDIVIARRQAADGQGQTGPLLFAGLSREGKPRAQLVRWGRDGQLIDAAGVGQTQQGLSAPVHGRVTSRYGMRRHPILGFTRMHAGIDFGAGHGSPIFATGDGVVSVAGWHGGHGRYVRIDHGGGVGTGYAHMSQIAVSPGTSVRQGQVIGYVGSSGLSTGPHLHYELYRNGRAVDPASLRFVSRAQLDETELVAFRKRLAQLLSLPVS